MSPFSDFCSNLLRLPGLQADDKGHSSWMLAHFREVHADNSRFAGLRTSEHPGVMKQVLPTHFEQRLGSRALVLLCVVCPLPVLPASGKLVRPARPAQLVHLRARRQSFQHIVQSQQDTAELK